MEGMGSYSMRILLTGGSGFIGSHLADELSDNGHDVDVFDRTLSKDQDLLTEEGVLNLATKLEYSGKPFDVVVHLAAQVGRVFGEDDTTHTINSNLSMTANVVRQLDHERFMYVSTSEVYGDQGTGICSEKDYRQYKRIPHNLYGLTKGHGEEISALYMPKGGLQVVRPSMPYGPGLPHGRGRAAIINMLWQADTGQEIPVHEGAERSWCWIKDLVRGFRTIIEKGEIAYSPDKYEFGTGCYNIGKDGESVSMVKVAELACEITGGDPSLIKMITAPANQTVVKRLSMDKLRSLGWEPEVSLRQGMEMTFEQIKDQW